MTPSHYVLGFLFSPERRFVLLIRKNRPSFLAGRLNGLGGSVEPGETALAAMVREVEEEAGIRVESWHPVAVLRDRHFVMDVFAAFDSRIVDAVTCTDEPVGMYEVHELVLEAPFMPLGPDLLALLHLALDDRLAKPVQLQVAGAGLEEPDDPEAIRLRQLLRRQGEAVREVIERAMRCRGEQSYRDTLQWATGHLGHTQRLITATLGDCEHRRPGRPEAPHAVTEAEHLAIMGWDELPEPVATRPTGGVIPA